MPASPDTGGVVAYTYPHTIENGAGERLTFVRRVRDEDGESLEVENLVRPGAGPPMYVHHRQEEALTVRQGRIGCERPGEPPRYAGPGETVVFGPGEPHRFWNAGEEDLACAGHVRSPDNLEYFLAELYRSQRENGGEEAGPLRRGVPGEALPRRVRHGRDPGPGAAPRPPGAGGRGAVAGQVREVRRCA